jgi:predicted RNase H-like nuclease
VKFVGIDLAWSAKNPSGVGVIESDGVLSQACSNLRSDQEIFKYAGLVDSGGAAVIAVDAPLIVTNTEGPRPVERRLTKIFGPFDAGPHSASLKNPAFRDTGRIQQFVGTLQRLGFEQRPKIRKQQPQRVFVEVFPAPAQVILFPCMLHIGHTHCRPPRYKHKGTRSRIETQCEWEIYRARILSLRAKDPSLRFAPGVKKELRIDIEDCMGSRYKGFDDLLDGIFCAYLAYYFWHWGEDRCAVAGDLSTGYVTLPRCCLPNCEMESVES